MRFTLNQKWGSLEKHLTDVRDNLFSRNYRKGALSLIAASSIIACSVASNKIHIESETSRELTPVSVIQNRTSDDTYTAQETIVSSPVNTVKPSSEPTPISTSTVAPPTTQPTFNYQTVLSEPIGQLIVDSDSVARRVASGVLYTFDDCESSLGQGNVAEYIRVLKSHGVKNAIFFMIGDRCYKARPDLVKMIKDAGYTIGSHGKAHRNMVNLLRDQGPAEVEREIIDSPHESIYFRPPGGVINAYVIERIRANGFIPINWSANGGDTGDGGKRTCNRILQDLVNTIRPGSIVLLHMQIYNSTKALDAYLSGKTC